MQTSFDGIPDSFTLTAKQIAHVLHSFVREEEQIQPTYGLPQVTTRTSRTDLSISVDGRSLLMK